MHARWWVVLGGQGTCPRAAPLSGAVTQSARPRALGAGRKPSCLVWKMHPLNTAQNVSAAAPGGSRDMRQPGWRRCHAEACSTSRRPSHGAWLAAVDEWRHAARPGGKRQGLPRGYPDGARKFQRAQRFLPPDNTCARAPSGASDKHLRATCRRMPSCGRLGEPCASAMPPAWDRVMRQATPHHACSAFMYAVNAYSTCSMRLPPMWTSHHCSLTTPLSRAPDAAPFFPFSSFLPSVTVPIAWILRVASAKKPPAHRPPQTGEA